MNDSSDNIDKVLDEITTELNKLEAQNQWKIDIAKSTSDDRYVIFFNGSEENCKHSKRVAKIGDYIFLFCSDTKNPVCIYCGSDIKSSDNAVDFLTIFAQTHTLLNDIIPDNHVFSSIYFEKLSKAVFNTKDFNLMEG